MLVITIILDSTYFAKTRNLQLNVFVYKVRRILILIKVIVSDKYRNRAVGLTPRLSKKLEFDDPKLTDGVYSM